jgi:hypothetical protein
MNSFLICAACFSVNVIRAIAKGMGFAGPVSRGEVRNVYKMLIGKPDLKGPFRRSMDKWEYYIEMYLKIL